MRTRVDIRDKPPVRRRTRKCGRGREGAAKASAAHEGHNSGSFDLDEAVVEGGGAAEVGQRLARDLIGVAAVRRELLPPDRQADYEPDTRLVGNAGAGLHRAAIVEDADLI